MKKLIFTAVILSIIIAGCNKNEDSDPIIKYGKNVFTTKVDGIDREYIVSIPKGYDGTVAFPVVYMLHGTSGNGEKFYNTSGWKELGEKENIITVFPSGLSYCINDDGEIKNISKWNTTHYTTWTYCTGVTPPDDIKFLKQSMDELGRNYNINKKRIYFVGFSNGGQMCARLAIELGDRIAAIVESGGSFAIDTTYTPVRKMPITFQKGNGDYGPNNSGPFIPLSKLDSLIQLPQFQLYDIAQTHIKSFDLNPNFTITGDTNKVVIATYIPNDGNTTNNFNVAYINGLTHQYPNGTNHWLHGAEVNWAWLKGFSLP